MNKQQNQHVNNITGSSQNKTGTRIGVVTSYNPYDNTATVLLSGQDSDEVDEMIQNVSCPTSSGVQNVAPEPGRMCVVMFKNGVITQPLITSFFNHSYSNFDYKRHNKLPYTVHNYLTSY